MSNPVLNERAFTNQRSGLSAPGQRPGWTAPDPRTRMGGEAFADRMTVSGTMLATGVLFAILLVTGISGWLAVEEPLEGQVSVPGWIWLPLIGGFVMAIAGTVKPTWARFTAPVYAAFQGLVLGAISHVFNIAYNGIVVMAVGATAAVFLSMLLLYSTRIIKVTDKFRRAVVAATMGIMLLYLVSFVFSLFGSTPSFINSSGGLGILLSVVVVGVAAFNLMLDFDLIERGAAAGAPKHMEWYAALGLMVTIVWLYLEILRLLAKLQDRR
jgi:uncharacterized YccA/Bax inhibitor family protein